MSTLFSVIVVLVLFITWEVVSSYQKRKKEANNLRQDAETAPATSSPQEADKQEQSESAKVAELPTSETLIKSFIAENSCRHEVHEDPKSNSSVYIYMFNGGQFRAVVSSRNQEALLAYDSFRSVPTNEADRMQRVANEANDNLKFYKVTVTSDEENNTADMNLLYEAMTITQEDIERFAYAAPNIANYVREALKEKIKTSESIERTFDRRRAFYLLREAELQHQDKQLISNPESPLTIGSLISQLFDADDAVRVEEMQYTVDGETTRLSDAEQIYKFHIIPTVYNIEQQQLLHGTVLQVRTSQYQYVFHLDAVSQSDFTVYIRLTAMHFEHDKDENTDKLPTLKPDSISIMVAYDKTTEQNQHSEFQYMWLDAKDKVEQGKQLELTEEQKILIDLENNEISEVIYRGNKHFLAGRYYEAIACLSNVYERMKREFFNLKDKQKGVFYEVCYIIGFSYCELKQYQRAYYYLEMAHWDAHYTYAEEYINSLANGADVRVFGEIDRLIQAVKQSIRDNEDGEADDNQRRFYEFLLRRRGYACIEFNDFDTAERIFKDLLQYPDSQEYAQSELDYISHLRQQKQNAEGNQTEG